MKSKRVRIRKDFPQRGPFRIISITDPHRGKRSGSGETWESLDRQLDRLRIAPNPKAVIKNSAVAELLGMTTRDIDSQARTLSVTAVIAWIEALAEELRRLNALRADQDGVTPNEAESLTWGESGVVKNRSRGTATEADIAEARRMVEHRLDGLIKVYEEQRESGQQIGQGIRSSRPGNAMSLDQVEKYGERQARMAAALQRCADEDTGVLLGTMSSNDRIAKSSAPQCQPWYMKTRS